MKHRHFNLMNIIMLLAATLLLAGCLSRGTFRSNLENYTGEDAAVIYLNDIYKKSEESLATYLYNKDEQCFEKQDEKQLTTIKAGNAPSEGITRFTIKPGQFYSARKLSYETGRNYIYAYSFIPKQNKHYFIGSGPVRELPDNVTDAYLAALIKSDSEGLLSLPKAESWDIKEKICPSLLGVADI